jgi:gamma-glutamyltranspeptidase/glutathione hydrolase
VRGKLHAKDAGKIMRNRFRSVARLLVPAVCLAMSAAGDLEAQDRAQARSVVFSRGGIVAAESPLAAQAGARVLERGGSAVDAAVATNAMMGVIAPMSNGIGGDLFAIVYDAKTGKLYGLNASGWAPAGLSIELMKSKGFRAMPLTGIYPVTVPGAVDGWAKLLERFGRTPLAELLAPAIHLAEDGFPVGEVVSREWTRDVNTVRVSENAARTFLISDRPPRAGEIFRNPDLAWSYKQLAAQGRDAFYKGEIARRILDTSRRHDGPMTAKDLAEYSSEWVEPISTTYRDWTVYELPPNGQGIAALEMLNILETLPLGQFGPNTVRTLHAMIEAKKLAYADLQRYIGDPKFGKLPVTELLSKDYARARAQQMDASKANCTAEAGNPVPTGGDTTYLSVVDREGNMVSLIQSNYEGFGSGLVPEGAGFVLQDRGALFSLDPASPNALAGRKRPLHTIIPAFLQKGDVRIAFGIMGGWNQAQAHAQFVANIVDFKMNIQAAIEAPRFSKRTFEGCDVEIEGRVPGNVRSELEGMGHKLEVRGVFSLRMGSGQATQRDFATGVNAGASDPRKDGAAVPELPPQGGPASGAQNSPSEKR